MTAYLVGGYTGGTGALTFTTIANSVPSTNRAATTNYIGAASGADIERGLFLVTLPGGLSGAGTVTNAKLNVLNADAVAATNFEVRSLANVHVKAEATWNNRVTATAWNVAGALTGTDVNATVLATGTSPVANARFDISDTGGLLNTWVQGLIAGSISVPALIISKVTDTSSFSTKCRFASDTHGTAANRPYLSFDFVPATPPSASGADVLCTRHDGTTTITVTLSEAAPVGGCSVDYATQDSTAISGQHYTGKTGTMTFAQGEQSKSEVLTIAP